MPNKELADRVIAAIGHCYPCDQFEEDEVTAIAAALGLDELQAWNSYQLALEEAQSDVPPAPQRG